MAIKLLLILMEEVLWNQLLLDLKKQYLNQMIQCVQGIILWGGIWIQEKFNFSSKIEENITLTAVWEEEEEVIYTVLFDSLSDDDYKVEVKEGETIKEVPIPEKEGYQFLYWCYHNKEFDFSTPIKSNMVMVAKYQKIDHEKEVVIVSFDSDGGSKIDNQEIEVGSQALEPKEPVKEGYRFMGWYLGKEKFDFKEEVKEDITLVALWEEE